MTPSGPFRCADSARARGDSLLGTAPRTDRWLLIEHPGPWKRDAVAGSGIAPHILASLNRVAVDQRARILLIRRPGRQHRGRSGSRSWAVCVGGGGTVWGSWRHDRDLRDAADALARPWPADDHDRDPVLLVCAHGVHDTCCAIRGRPVAQALQGRWPDRTWECSHVGGDRFAGNLVLLPDGFYYGNLDGQTAPDVVALHLAGRVPVDFLRGMARHPPPVQTAVGALHRQLGPLGANDVAVVSAERTGPSAWTVAATVAGTAELVRVDVVGKPAAPARLTCHALRDSAATAYEAAVLR